MMKSVLKFFLVLLLATSLVACKPKDPKIRKNEYNVEFINSTIDSNTVLEGQTVSKPENPIIEGFLFENWYTDNELTKLYDFNKPITSDVKIYAAFFISVSKIQEKGQNLDNYQLSVEFYFLKGSVTAISKENHTITIHDGVDEIVISSISIQDELGIKDEVTVRGQISKNDSGVIFQNSEIIKVTKYEKPTATLTVEFFGANIAPVLVTEGDQIVKPEDPVKADYHFKGWYLDEGYTNLYNFDNPILQNTKLYGLFTLDLKKAAEIGATLIGDELSENFYFKGTIKSITNSDFGSMVITDGTNDLFVYGVWSKDNEKYSSLIDKPVINDIIYLYGALKNYNGSVELNRGTLVRFEKGVIPPFDITDYEESNLKLAYEKPVDSKVLVEGIVIQKTKQSKNQDNGVFITDETGAIYIYSPEIASSVSIGDRIKVAGIRTNFILETEISFAEMHQYQGAIQIAQTHLVSHEKNDETPNLDWTRELSLQSLLETKPQDENITGTIFKTKAFINKAVGTGFVNYYFNDFDNVTGTYTYSMNNGSDFSWLDQYDGQLREVYVSVLNAKSTVSGIVYRLVPIKIGDVYVFEEKLSPNFAIRFIGEKQFEKSYIYPFSPDKEVITNIDIPHFNINGISLTYTSSDDSIAKFEVVGDKTIFKTREVGKSTITITATYNEFTLSKDFVVEVKQDESVTMSTVLEVINKEKGETVYVEGVVGPSLVNKVGFYIVDDSGIIAVEMTGDELAKVNQGNKVIIKGIKDYGGQVVNTSGEITANGTTAIRSAEIIVNKYGTHEYSTLSFNGGDKVVNDFLNLDLVTDYSTTIYTLEGTIKYIETNYYKRYQIEDENGNYILIYASSASQLKFLDQFRDQLVKMEFTLVNWNGKAWRGSVLSVLTAEGKVINNSNF